MIRHAPTLMLLLLSLGQAVLGCSVNADAEDTTGQTTGIAMIIFVIGLFVAVAHLGVFIYRRGHNRWVFWITFALSLVIMPISLFLMMLRAGTACGEGTIEIAGFTLAFQVAGLAAQLFSWKFLAGSYRLTIPRD